MYALLASLEKDARVAVILYLEPQIGLEEIVKPFQEKLIKRNQNNNVLDARSIELLDFADIFEIFNRYSSYLPKELNSDLDALRSNITKLVQIRNKIMHARPLDGTDPDTLTQILVTLRTQWWGNLHDTQLALKSGNLNVQVNVLPDESNIFHNLPAVDHSETGLIGRTNEVETVTRLLLDDRMSVVTLTGEGGIGKTALAQQVAYRFLDLKEPMFDAILWVSLKTERLTVEGIEQISDAIRSLPEAIIELGRAIDESFDGAVETLASGLEDLKVLICLDNMETTTGEDFMKLYDAMPKTVKFLITSRRGIGQIERRVIVDALTPQDALHYLHLIIKSRGAVDLEKSSIEVKKNIVERYKCNPLAIKWFVQSAATGRPITEIFLREQDFLDFCIKSVIEQLSEAGLQVLTILSMSRKPMLIEAIMAASPSSSEDVYEGIRSLTQNALIRSAYLGNEQMRQTLQLTETAVQYLRNTPVLDPTAMERINRRLVQLQHDEEDREREARVNSFSPFSVEVRDESDIAVAHLLRSALRRSKNSPKEGLALLTTARQLAPDYWEVDRVEAWIRHFFADPSDVIELFEAAIRKAPNAREAAKCKHWLAGHLASSLSAAEALPIAIEAHMVLQNPVTLHLIGNLRIRDNHFEEGIAEIEASIPGTVGRTRIIHTTSLIIGYKRWAEYVFKNEKNHELAFSLLIKAMDAFDIAYQNGIRDFKMKEVNGELVIAGWVILRRSRQMGLEDFEKCVPQFISLLKYPELALENAQFGEALTDAFLTLREENQEIHEFFLRRNIQEIEKLHHAIRLSTEEEEYKGIIIRIIDEKYGFIQHANFPRNVYFSDRVLDSAIRITDFEPGSPVRFRIDKERSTDIGRAAFARTVTSQ